MTMDEDMRKQCQWLFDQLPDAALYELRESLIHMLVFYTDPPGWSSEWDANEKAKWRAELEVRFPQS